MGAASLMAGARIAPYGAQNRSNREHTAARWTTRYLHARTRAVVSIAVASMREAGGSTRVSLVRGTCTVGARRVAGAPQPQRNSG